MANSKFKWTQYLIECDKKYDGYAKNIRQGVSKDYYLKLLTDAADSAKRESLSGYAAYLLYELYSEGEYVELSQELAMKYLELGRSLGDTESMIIHASRYTQTGSQEDLDKKLEEIINNGCDREYLVWEMRAYMRTRKSRKFLPSNVTPIKTSYFLRLKYMLKAKSTLPKQKYFDSIRRRYKKDIRKMLALPIAVLVLALLISLFASLS